MPCMPCWNGVQTLRIESRRRPARNLHLYMYIPHCRAQCSVRCQWTTSHTTKSGVHEHIRDSHMSHRDHVTHGVLASSHHTHMLSLARQVYCSNHLV
eukprot:6467364-Amphidinium_carterae.1